jgi:hypothetical protein
MFSREALTDELMKAAAPSQYLAPQQTLVTTSPILLGNYDTLTS